MTLSWMGAGGSWDLDDPAAVRRLVRDQLLAGCWPSRRAAEPGVDQHRWTVRRIRAYCLGVIPAPLPLRRPTVPRRRRSAVAEIGAWVDGAVGAAADRPSSTPPPAASPVGASARPRSTTSLGRPGQVGPPPTACSRAARTGWSRCCSSIGPAFCSTSGAPSCAAAPSKPPGRRARRRHPAPARRRAGAGRPRARARARRYFAFDRLDRVFDLADALCRPHLALPAPRQDPARVRAVGAHGRELRRRTRGSTRDPAVRRLVRYLMPAVAPRPSPASPRPRRTREHQRRADRPRRRRRPRSHPRRDQHRRGRGDPHGAGQRRRHLHVGLREGRARPSTVSTRRRRPPQWNGETDLPWDTEVDQEAVVMANATANLGGLAGGIDPSVIADSPARGARRSGSRSASRARTGRSASSCTASRAR